MLAGECNSRFAAGERERAWRAAIEFRGEGLLVLTKMRLSVMTRVDVAVANHISGFRIDSFLRDVVVQVWNHNPAMALDFLRTCTGQAAEDRFVVTFHSGRPSRTVHRPPADVAHLLIPALHETPSCV